MAAPINLPVNAPANIDTPSTGRYNLFLNSSDSDQLYKKDSSGVSTAVVIAGSGTVTSVSVVSANGLAGTVANATTTPAITLSTSINSPVLAGNGTALIAATTTGSGSTVVLNTSPTFVTDISAPKIISSTVSGGLLFCNNNGVTVASFGVGSAGSTNIALIGATAVTGTISGTSSLTLGTASTTVGSIVLQNATNANTLTIQSGVTSASYSLTLPTAQGGANTYLKNDGAGTLSWATVASGISIGDAIGNSPVTGSVLMAIGGVITQSISYRAQQATPFGTAFGFASMSGNTGVNNTAFGYNSGLGQTTGTDNLYLGYNAGFRNISGNRNIYLGGISGDVLATNQSDNIFIGVGAGLHASAGSNIVIGAGGQTGAGLGIGNVSIGHQSMFNCTSAPTYNVSVGFYAGYSASGDGSVYLGALAGFGDNHFRAIGLGNQAIPSQDNELMIGGVDTWFGGTGATTGITNVCIGNGNTYTSASSVTIRVTSGSGSNNAGGSLTLAAGKGTGTAAGGTYKAQTSVKGSSGTTIQSLTDRHTAPAKYVDITGGAATTFANLALATSSTIAGGVIVYTVEANDGTDFQSLTGTAPYSVVNKAGTLTYVLGTDVQSSACSAGTLTGTLSLTASGTTMGFQMNAVSSLVETVLRVSFQVLNNMGVTTVTAA